MHRQTPLQPCNLSRSVPVFRKSHGFEMRAIVWGGSEFIMLVPHIVILFLMYVVNHELIYHPDLEGIVLLLYFRVVLQACILKKGWSEGIVLVLFTLFNDVLFWCLRRSGECARKD